MGHQDYNNLRDCQISLTYFMVARCSSSVLDFVPKVIYGQRKGHPFGLPLLYKNNKQIMTIKKLDHSNGDLLFVQLYKQTSKQVSLFQISVNFPLILKYFSFLKITSFSSSIFTKGQCSTLIK